LTDPAAAVGAANLTALGSNRFQIQMEAQSGAFLQGQFVLARLGFMTVSNEHSAIVTLTGENLMGSRASSTMPLEGAANLGRVFVVGQEPILDGSPASDRQLALTLYARPGEKYTLERQSGIVPGGWMFDSLVTTENLRTELPLRPAESPVEFFRAYLVSGDFLSIRFDNGQVVIEWPAACNACVLEESGELGANANWVESAMQPVEINGRQQVMLALPAVQRFYRLARPQP
jgi:hypothetical protein